MKSRSTVRPRTFDVMTNAKPVARSSSAIHWFSQLR